MAGYRTQNRNTITKSFQRLRKSEERTMCEGLIRVAKAGMKYLMEAHENHPVAHNHLGEDDTMAYVIVHNEVIVAVDTHRGGGYDLPGKALEKASRLLSGVSGWAVIILSDMEFYWYRVDWEINFLQSSADEIRDKFHTYFHKV